MSLLTLFDSSGPTPAFAANFLSGYLPPGLTYTNSSTTRTYFGSDGLLKTAVANEPIFEYNPTTLALLGMRWEMEQRTNLLLHSGDFTNSAWQGTGLTKTGGQPDSRGGSAAVLLTGPSSSSTLQSVTASTSGAHTYRIVAKGVSGTTQARFLIRNITTATNDIVGVVNPITGAIVSGAGWTSRAVGNGFFEYKFTTTITITAGNTLSAYYADTSLLASGFNLIVDYAQLEAGASASSYIPTTTAAVIRQPDVLTATSISPWYRQDEGTVVFDWISSVVGGGADRACFAFNDGTNNNRTTLDVINAGTARLYIKSGGVTQVTSFNGAVTQGAVSRAAIAYKLNDCGISLNGGSATVDISATQPAGVNALRFGYGAAAGVINPFMGYARRFSYYPRRLPDAQIQGMSRV